MVRALLGLLSVLGLAACTVDATVLAALDAGGARDCVQAWAAGAGTACAGELLCDRPSPASPSCCTQYLYCSGDKLVGEESCPFCAPCTSDLECEFALALCVADQCERCPPEDVCPPCEDGFVPLLRNGCNTCFCAPPSECSDPSDCLPPEMCYQGMTCAKDCALDDMTCCANACASADPPCLERAPIGCAMACADLGLPCPLCAAASCECVLGEWRCTPICSFTINDSCTAR